MSTLGAVSQVVAAISGAGLLGIAHRIHSTREKPAARSFVLLSGTLGVTALCAGVTAHTGTPYKLLWLYTSLTIPLALAVFSLDYHGLASFVSRTRACAAATPAAIGAAAGTAVILGTPRMSPGTATPVPSLAGLPAGAFEVANTLTQVGLYYTTAVALLAVGLVLRTVYRYDHIDGRLGLAVGFVGVWPWLAYIVVPQLSGLFTPAVGLATVALGYAGSALVAAIAVGPLGLFVSSPAAGNVGPETVLDSMDDAVVVTDSDGRVLRMNAVASRTFDVSPADVVGGPVSDVVARPLDALAGEESVRIDTRDGTRQFDVTRSAVTDRTDTTRGHALVFRDVTRRLTREQRLGVLNRVLRHNLRNDATTIIGRAELIADGGNAEERAERIVETTNELLSTAQRAREIETMLSRQDGGVTPVRAVLDDIVDGIADDYPSVEVTTALPEGATAAAGATALGVVLRNVVENAAEHNDADEPFVVVAADHTGEMLDIAVADNGPGIPEHERSTLDTGEESQLRHGSGLGLWAAQWGVTKMGGRLSFSANEPRGSVVTVSVPAAAGENTSGTTETG